MDFSFRDNLRAFIEQRSDGRNTVMYDKYGNPNVMVCIPKWNLRDIGIDKDGPHPGFVINGKEVDEIYVSKFVATRGESGSPAHMPGCIPWTNIAFDDAKSRCANMGEGWHLMTNAEWAAISLITICSDRATGCGKFDAFTKKSPGRTYRCVPDGTLLTGCFPHGGNHDRTECGISDMVGMIDQYVDGILITDGIKMRINLAGTDLNNMMSISDTMFDTKCGFDSFPAYSIAIDSITPVADEKFANSNNPSVVNTMQSVPVYKVDTPCPKSPFIWADIMGLSTFNKLFGTSGSYAHVKFTDDKNDRVVARGGTRLAAKAGLLDYNVSVRRDECSPYIGFRAAYVPSL